MTGKIPTRTKLIVRAFRRKFSSPPSLASSLRSKQVPKSWFLEPTKPSSGFKDIMKKKSIKMTPSYIREVQQKYWSKKAPYNYA